MILIKTPLRDVIPIKAALAVGKKVVNAKRERKRERQRDRERE